MAAQIVAEDVEAISLFRVSELEHVLSDRCRHIVRIRLVTVRVTAQVGRYESVAVSEGLEDRQELAMILWPAMQA